MDRPTQHLSDQVQETCPQCRSLTPPVVTEQTTPDLLTAAYRCIICRTDFTSIWQLGYVRHNQPPLPFDDTSPATQDVFTRDDPNWQPPSMKTTDNLCQKCLAQPGTPHALACPYA